MIESVSWCVALLAAAAVLAAAPRASAKWIKAGLNKSLRAGVPKIKGAAQSADWVAPAQPNTIRPIDKPSSRAFNPAIGGYADDVYAYLCSVSSDVEFHRFNPIYSTYGSLHKRSKLIIKTIITTCSLLFYGLSFAEIPVFFIYSGSYSYSPS
jgi:hypothetical protein